MDLEQKIREKLWEKTSAIIRMEKGAIIEIKRECYKRCINENNFPGNEVFFTHLLQKWFTVETLSHVCQSIYTLTPEEVKAMYVASEEQQELDEENEAAYQNLQKRTEEFHGKIKNITHSIKENKLELDAILYNLVRIEFKDKKDYIQFFSDFYTTYYHASKPQLNASKIFFRAIMKVRRLITAKEADKIFQQQN